MRKLIVSSFISLDGVMQAPGGPEEDRTGGFAHGGWTVEYWDEAMNEAMGRLLSVPVDLLLGRRTYEIFAAHWPASREDEAAPLNLARKYVASRTLTQHDLAWEHSHLLEGDAAAAVAALKRESGPDLLVYGSANLVQTLLARDLVDEFQLLVFPVLLGDGKRLFAGGTLPRALQLVESRTSTTGVVMATYRPAGAVRTGSFALQDPTPAELTRRERWARAETAR